MQELNCAAIDAQPGNDSRRYVELGGTVIRTDLAACSVGQCEEFGTRFYATRQDNYSNQPEGHWYTRCPNHYAKHLSANR